MSATDGANYAPDPMPAPVVGPGEFVFAAIGLDHGHIGGMCQGLIGAGAQLKWVYDPDPAKVAAFRQNFPQVRVRVVRPRSLRMIRCIWWPGLR
ncbi:hypothetical protein [Sanguibacter sp. Z1732]|uniref:hypothetical protein n=1 Tax=Sanguibacter sp. Z1732 TaxID=3435412 RepID=UPI003D9C8849